MNGLLLDLFIYFVCVCFYLDLFYVHFLMRRLFEVLGSKFQRRVRLLLDVAQKSSWKCSVYQSSTVSSNC